MPEMETTTATHGESPAIRQQSVGQDSMSTEYWDPLVSLYPEADSQTQEQQQQQAVDGIAWDQSVFPEPQQDQQSQIRSQNEPPRDLYSTAPQSWEQNPTITSGHGYNLPPPQQHYQVSYPQDQGGYNRSLGPADNLSLNQPFTFSESYFQPPPQVPPPHLTSRPETITQQSVASPNAPGQAGHQFILPANYGDHTRTGYTGTFQQQGPNVGFQHTINPQYLTPTTATGQPQGSSQNQFLFYNPAASTYERPNDPRNYQVFPSSSGPVSTQQPLSKQVAPPQGPAGQFSTFQALPPAAQSQPAVGVNGVIDASKGKPTPAAKKKTTQTKTKKTASKDPKKPSEPDSDSESSDESDLEIEEPEEPSPLPAVRPTDPEAAAEYDTLSAVWAPRNRRPKVEKIKTALVAFKDVVKAVRDEWKTQSQAMKDAENKSENEKAAELKKKVIAQRKIMEVVINATLNKGHPIIVEKLGEHPVAVSALYSFLLDRHQAADFEGTLTVSILKLLSQFTTVDEDILQKTNLSKLLPRIMKKGGKPVQELCQKILDNAAATTKRKSEASKDAASRKEGTPGSSSAESTSGVKRPREGEVNGAPATKKTVQSSTAKPASSTAKSVASSGKRPDGTTDGKSSTAPAGRPKTSIVAPKPTVLFSSLTSASKKPGTSNAARAAAAAAAAKEKANQASGEKKKEEPSTSAPAQKPALSFGEILAGLNKPDEAKEAKQEETRPSETEEERAKRLRKEARRKLRVSWKPDDSLVEVRLFTHHPEEEIGPDDRLRRDAGDIKGEGRMLKLHKELEEEDEDEEMGIQEEALGEYRSPSEIDLDVLPEEDRKRNFIKRGGIQEPDSPEKLAQEQREANSLMVFYTSPADVPWSPKEPPPPPEDEPATTETPFGEPDERVQARSARYFAMRNGSQTQPQPSTAATAPAATAPTIPNGPLDIASLLKSIQTAQQTQQPPPQPTQPTPGPFADLERTVNLFRQQQGQPPVSIPQVPAVPQMPATSGQPIDFQKILAVLNASKQMQQAAPPMPMTVPQAINPNLAAIISQLSGASQQQASQPPSQSSTSASSTAPSTTSGIYEDPERKRLREMGHSNPHDDRQKRPRMYVDPKAKRHPKAGSVPCRYWREGKCLKGEDCTFRHDPLD